MGRPLGAAVPGLLGDGAGQPLETHIPGLRHSQNYLGSCLPGNNGDHGTTAGDHRITGAIEPAEERRKETDDETANQGHTIDSFGRTLDPLSPLLRQD